MKLLQWAVLDLSVFREEWASNRSALKYQVRDNRDGTFFHAFEIDSFRPELVIGASENLAPLLNPLLAIPYIDRPIAPPDEAETAKRLVRDNALREWHCDPSIKVDFETYWTSLQGRPE